MRSFLSILLAVPVTLVSAQVEITTNDLPDAGDLLVQVPATFLVEVDLEAAGPGYAWTFAEEELQVLGTTTETNCVNVNDLDWTYQLVFNNPFDPDHNSDFAIGTDGFEVLAITFEDVYMMYQNRDDRYAMTGMAATINSLPTGGIGDPVDVIYNLPLQYGDQDDIDSEITFEVPTIGYYHLVQNRVNDVDGWGTLNIFGQEFEALRVRTEIEASDSVYLDFIGNGFTFDRPLAVEYKWLSPGYKTPILQVTTTAGIVTSVLLADMFAGVREESTVEVSLYPNPATEYIRVTGEVLPNASYIIYTSTGVMVCSGKLGGSGSINVSDLAAGEYFLFIEAGGSWNARPFLRQ